MRLLLVEDDGDVAETLTAYLERQGFVVDRAGKHWQLPKTPSSITTSTSSCSTACCPMATGCR